MAYFANQAILFLKSSFFLNKQEQQQQPLQLRSVRPPVRGKERAGTRCCPWDSALAALEQGSSGVSLQAPLSCCCHVTTARCLLEAQHRKTLKCSQSISRVSVWIARPACHISSAGSSSSTLDSHLLLQRVVLLPEGPENSTLLEGNLC